MKLILCIILVLLPSAVFSQDTWTTTEKLGPTTTLKMHWSHAYEGFETAFLFEFYRSGELTKSIKLSGQPLFNPSKTILALPSCWDGGCELSIRLIDLENFVELHPITFQKESFLDCAWLNNNELEVIQGAMGPGGTTTTDIFAVLPKPRLLSSSQGRETANQTLKRTKYPWAD